MADTLRRLTNTSSFSVLQDKLESWHNDYHVSQLISDERPKSDQRTSPVVSVKLATRSTEVSSFSRLKFGYIWVA